MKTKTTLPLIALILLTANLACCASNGGTPGEETNAINCEKYEKIANTMSMSDVIKIMGSKGKVAGINYAASLGETDSYSWKNPDGSEIIITFLDDRVIDKSETNICTISEPRE